MHSALFVALLSANGVFGASLKTSKKPASSTCVCTKFSQIAAAVANCTDIRLQNIVTPTNKTLDLSGLKDNSVVTFAGKTTFEFTNSSSFNPISFGGNHVKITSCPGAIIDGGGQMYWDGLGSNGGLPKPNSFIKVKMTNGSVIENLHIQNYPAHGFNIGQSSDLTIRGIFIDNSAGDAPNNRSNGKSAAHNSDGFGVGTLSNNVLIDNCTVYNQDDCVAVTSGNNITASNIYCSGSHGLSIGSIGGKQYNNVTNVLFTNSYLRNSTNGPRIKSNFNTTGYIANITYSNIQLYNASDYGIDVQQDYLNGGPTGNPSNGVIIENVLFKNVTGTATKSGRNYYVLCGDGSCKNLSFENVHITGGGKNSSCNFPATGCPA